MSKVEKVVQKNEGQFVGGKRTWIDIYFVAILDYREWRGERRSSGKISKTEASEGARFGTASHRSVG